MHYGVPEGSYASTPDGPARIREHRAMVQALHKMGLRVVLDVVYNHTFAAGEPWGTDPEFRTARLVSALQWQAGTRSTPATPAPARAQHQFVLGEGALDDPPV